LAAVLNNADPSKTPGWDDLTSFQKEAQRERYKRIRSNYVGQTVEWTLRVEDVTVAMKGDQKTPVIKATTGGSPIISVTCYLLPAEAERLASVNKGASVKIKGVLGVRPPAPVAGAENNAFEVKDGTVAEAK